MVARAVGITEEINDLSAAVVWATVPDAFISESSVVQHEAALTITESQISDLQDYALNSALTAHTGDASIHFTEASISITESQISDLQAYLLTEVNDLTVAVTWANVPDANITESSVTQHEAALTITESQISDLHTPATPLEVEDESISLATAVTKLNFLGSGVTAVENATNEIDITILAGGDVVKVGTPVDDQIGVWTGDGTLEGDPDFTWNGERLLLAFDHSAPDVNDIGFVIVNPNSILNPEGWQITEGTPGIFDGELLFASDPADTIANLKMRLMANNNVIYPLGAGVSLNFAFRSEAAGALTYFMPQDTIGREETKISFVGEVGGTGHEGVFSIEGFAYGNTGLQFHRLFQCVIAADYELRIDSYAKILIGNVVGEAPLAAGDNAGMGYSAEFGLELTGQGTTNDVTIFNDTHTPVIEIPTGTLNVNFAGNVRPAGTVEWDKGADIASAATLILGSDGNSFDVTGTTTITAISAKPIGTVIILRFDDVAVVEHNATTLILQAGDDIVPEAGNTYGFYCYDGTNWQEIFRNDGQQVRVSGSIADQAMVRGNGGSKRISDTGNFIGDDDEMIMAGTVILASFTDAQLNDNGNSVNTNGGKALGAMVFNSDQGHAVTAQGGAAGDVWNDGAGTLTNTPV